MAARGVNLGGRGTDAVTLEHGGLGAAADAAAAE